MFCYKCGEVLENENCQMCNVNSMNENNVDLSPVCFGFLSTTKPLKHTIMAMGQVFDDQRRRWGGYWIYFYPHEFAPPENKSLDLLHIHFKGQEGEIRVYLSDSKYLDIDEKWGYVPSHERTKIKKFVERHKQDILSKIENELKKSGIKN